MDPSSPLKGRLPALKVGRKRTKVRIKSPASKDPPGGSKHLKLRCPIRAQCPDRYRTVHKHCREDQCFPGTGPLNEHLRRYHSLRYWCTKCKKNFATATETTIAALEESHQCVEKEWTEEESMASHTWMTEKQQEAWNCWKNTSVEVDKKEGVQIKNWKKIHRSLYPDVEVFPNPCYEGSVPYSDEEAPRAGPTIPTASNAESLGIAKSTDNAEIAGSAETIVVGAASIERKATSEQDIDQPSSLRHDTSAAQEDISLGDPDPLSNDLIFRSPYSGDLTFTQHILREAARDEADWDDTTEGPWSMAYSSTSGGTGTYSASQLASLQREPQNQKHLTYLDDYGHADAESDFDSFLAETDRETAAMERRQSS